MANADTRINGKTVVKSLRLKLDVVNSQIEAFNKVGMSESNAMAFVLGQQTILEQTIAMVCDLGGSEAARQEILES